MALPRTIGDTISNLHGVLGPFRASNGDHYVVLQDGTAGAVWKADNGDNTWSEQDAADRPDPGSGTVHGMAAVLDGTSIHISACREGATDNILYAEFNTSTDQWVTTSDFDVVFTDSTGDVTPAQSTGIGVRSDGDIIIVGFGAAPKTKGTPYQTIRYNVHQGTGWTDASGTVSDGGTTNYTHAFGVMGASDLFHIVYFDGTDIQHKSLNSSNSLSSAEAVNDNTIVSTTPGLQPVYWDNGGTETIIVPFIRNVSSLDTVYISQIVSDGTPGAEAAVSDTQSIDLPTSQNYAAFMAVDDTNDERFLVYADATDNDVYFDEDTGSGWGTDSEILNTVNVTQISATSLVNDGGDTVLAYVYNDGGTVKYNEYVTTAGAVTIDVDATGTTSSSATSTGSMTRGVNATGTTSSSATSTGTTTRGVDATGTTTSSATATADVPPVDVDATGTTTSSATSTGSMTRGVNSTGTTTSSATSTGAIARGVDSTGTTTSSATSTGSVVRGVDATGTTSSSATSSGDVTRGVDATGTTTSSATSTGTTTRGVNATGTTTSSATATAEVPTINVDATGTTSSSATSTGAIARGVDSTGTTSSSATSSGSMVRGVDSTGTTSSSATGAGSATRGVDAVGTTTSSASSTESVTRGVDAIGTTLSSATATSGTIRIIDATGTTISSATATAAPQTTPLVEIDTVVFTDRNPLGFARSRTPLMTNVTDRTPVMEVRD
jgi:hypothetical protein